jgi:uncharacterized coiled-coil protein SlyX
MADRATNQDLTQKIDELETGIAQEHEQYVAVVGGLNDEITRLREEVAAGGGATQEQLGEHLTRLEALRGQLAAIVPDEAPPLPDVPNFG